MKRLDAKSLENAALFYLQRYASSAANLRRVLKDKARRHALKANEEMPADVAQWIEEIVLKMVDFGYINDVQYAEMKVRSMSLAHKSVRQIQNYLVSKGINADIISAAIETQIGDDYAFDSATKLAKRRRIGPFRREKLPTDFLQLQKIKQREYGVLARAGFDLEVIKMVLGKF